ncbi:MAG: hypothetical protein M3Y18_09130 [Candidatus Eremiobacteraeota bacterium]|nr:hypothetical protein [Candidatus Eremiobacteraeota bacterium]
MAYAFTQDMPTGKDMYTKLSDLIGDESPKGLIVHLAFEIPGGMRIVDVWESEADYDQFAETRLRPAFEKVLQEAVTRESLGTPQDQDLTPIEIFGAGLQKKRFSN